MENSGRIDLCLVFEDNSRPVECANVYPFCGFLLSFAKQLNISINYISLILWSQQQSNDKRSKSSSRESQKTSSIRNSLLKLILYSVFFLSLPWNARNAFFNIKNWHLTPSAACQWYQLLHSWISITNLMESKQLIIIINNFC